MFSNIFFTDEDILKIKNSNNPELKAYVEETLAEAERLIHSEQNEFAGLLGRFEQIMIVCFAYKYTGNKEYEDKAREILKYKIELLR